MTWVAAYAKKPGEERINGEKAEARPMESKGDDGGRAGSGEAVSAHGVLWMVVSMSTCEVPCALLLVWRRHFLSAQGFVCHFAWSR